MNLWNDQKLLKFEVNSFILVTLLFDSRVIHHGKIGYQLLFGLKG